MLRKKTTVRVTEHTCIDQCLQALELWIFEHEPEPGRILADVENYVRRTLSGFSGIPGATLHASQSFRASKTQISVHVSVGDQHEVPARIGRIWAWEWLRRAIFTLTRGRTTPD